MNSKETFDKTSYLLGFVDGIEQRKSKVKETCKWADETSWDDQFYLTSCGHSQFFSDGRIKENDYDFCPYCGKQIEEVKDAG